MGSLSERQFQIIKTAGKLLTDSGLSGLTIKNIASHMGFAEGALYRHFSGKEELIVALLNHLSEEIQLRHNKLIKSDDNALTELEILFLDQVEYFKKHPYFIGAVFSDGLLDASKEINKAIQGLMTIRGNFISTALEKGKKANLFRTDLPTEDLAHILMGSFRLLMLKWKMSNYNHDVSKKGKELFKSLITLISK